MSKKRQAQHRLGPQRNPEIDDAVLQATRELLVENGYAGTSIDAIATRAGVGRPAIYRRWPSKAHIVHDAVYPVAESENVSDLPIGEEVERLTYGAVALFGGPAAREAVPALMSEIRTDETLRQALLTDQLEVIREELGRRLRAGAAAANCGTASTRTRCWTSSPARRSSRSRSATSRIRTGCRRRWSTSCCTASCRGEVGPRSPGQLVRADLVGLPLPRTQRRVESPPDPGCPRRGEGDSDGERDTRPNVHAGSIGRHEYSCRPERVSVTVPRQECTWTVAGAPADHRRPTG